MTRKLFAAAAACALGAASFAHAGTVQVDLSPYVNQSFASSPWFIDGGQFAADLPGTSTGNQGSSIPFLVANVPDGFGGANNFWYGLDDGTQSNNLFGGSPGAIHIAVATTGVQSVYTLADNVFGRDGALEYAILFHGAGGDLEGDYIGGQNTKDYNTPNCDTTGCDFTAGATDWYNDSNGIVLQQVQWDLPANFGLTSMDIVQVDGTDGVILAGVTLGVPEPASWALMISGFGLAGATLRRRRAAIAA